MNSEELKFLLGLLAFSFFCSPAMTQSFLKRMYSEDVTFQELVEETDLFFRDREKGRGSGYKQYERWKYWNGRNLDASGLIIRPDVALSAVDNFESKNDGKNKSLDTYWRTMGPTAAVNTSTWSSHLGRVSALGVDPRDLNHFIVGSPSGGVWKTTDEGNSWIPIFDFEAMISVYSLAIHPTQSQTYYCGTYGLGIMKSSNGGASWQPTTGIPANALINSIVLNPENPAIVLAINQWGSIYRSNDEGENWTEVYTSPGNDLYDIEFKPGNPSVVYASGAGLVLHSANNGELFVPLTGPWNSASMMLAVTPAAPDHLYVLQSDQGGFGALYLSIDGGVNFSMQSDDSGNNNNIMGYSLFQKGGQAPRDMDIVVSPTDASEVHVAGIMTFKSTDSGLSWDQTTHWIISNPLPFIHADVDLMQYIDGTIFFGTDGGIFISNDGLASVIDKTQGIASRQFYRIGVSQTEMDCVSGGSQDNGTGVIRSGIWYDFVGADGMETFIDHSNSDIVYASIQYGSLYKSIDGGNTLTTINDAPGSGAWVTPLEQDPVLPNVIYQGKRHLYKSLNGGITWDTVTTVTPTHPQDNLIQELKIAPNDANTIYMAYRYQMYATTDGGLNWTDITPPISFSGINYIAVHPSNAGRLLIALSGATAKFMESTDGGTSWTDITNNLPNISAQCAIYEGGSQDGIFVGMGPGIYYTHPSLSDWQFASKGLPRVTVTELEIANNYIYAGTYGRGLWKSRLGTLPPHCSDGIYNGDESWIDCGGSCMACSDCDGDSESVSGLIPDNTHRRMDQWISLSATLAGGTEAQMQARNFVEFAPGTVIEQSSVLNVLIGPCNN